MLLKTWENLCDWMGRVVKGKSLKTRIHRTCYNLVRCLRQERNKRHFQRKKKEQDTLINQITSSIQYKISDDIKTIYFFLACIPSKYAMLPRWWNFVSVLGFLLMK